MTEVPVGSESDVFYAYADEEGFEQSALFDWNDLVFPTVNEQELLREQTGVYDVLCCVQQMGGGMDETIEVRRTGRPTQVGEVFEPAFGFGSEAFDDIADAGEQDDTGDSGEFHFRFVDLDATKTVTDFIFGFAVRGGG